MSDEAPERIWLCDDQLEFMNDAIFVSDIQLDNNDVEYIRAEAAKGRACRSQEAARYVAVVRKLREYDIPKNIYSFP